jgi:nucleotide-binding universal stress UspA family protein
MPEHILVPFDGSPLAEQALEYSCKTFGDGTITVFYVIDSHTDDTAASGWGSHPSQLEDWLEDRREHAEELFQTAQSIADEYDVTLLTGVAGGRIKEMILRAIDEYDIDHVVMGTHGRPQLEELIFGSVAEALVRESPVPVTTVR